MKNYVIAFILSSVFSLNTIAQIPRGDRLMSYSIAVAEEETFDQAFQSAYLHCLDVMHMQFPWGLYETDAGVFDQEAMGLMDITNIYFPAYGRPIELNLGTMNTTVNAIPADLQSHAYDEAIMATRFMAFLDTLFLRIPDVEISLLTIGNESDIYMGTDPLLYSKYKVFLDAVIPYAKQKYFELHDADLNVGTTLTLEGLRDPVRGPLCHLLNEDSDIISVTYYPLIAGFQMNEPEAVLDDFADLIAEYPNADQPIYMVECGYASSPTCGSSEQMQAEFFYHVFTAWDTYYDNIKFISIFIWTDWSQEYVTELGEYYGLDDPAFLEYLRTIGLRTFPGAGTDKEAVNTIACELESRDWCSTVSCSVGIEEQALSAVQLYPNPVSTLLQINGLEIVQGNISLSVFDIQGKEIMHFNGISSRLQRLDLSELESGIYILSLQSEGGYDSKFIIHKE